jgi:hypothetical protein
MVPAEPADVVHGQLAPECPERWAGGAILSDRGQQFVEGLLPQRAGYIWHTNTFVSIGTTGAIIAWSM